MEPEEPYIPFKERTPKEVCRDITIKAEKFLKSYKIRVIIIPVICLVLVALSWYFMPNVNWWTGLGIFGVVEVCFIVIFIEVCFIVIYIYTQKLIHEMHLVANPKQFLPIAKRLKEFVRYSNYFMHVISFWISISLLSGFKDLWWWNAVALVLAAGLALLVPFTEKEAAFRDDVDDLERSLSYQVS